MTGAIDILPTTDQRQFKTGLVVTTYNRPWYAWRTLRCLQATLADSDVALVVADDASSSRATLAAIRQFARSGLPVTTILKKKRTGFDVHTSLKLGWDYLREHHGCELLLNIDSDVLSKPGWLETMTRIFRRERQIRGPLWLTGFNTPNHPVLEQHDDYCIKKSFGGVNTCFDLTLYDEIIRPNLGYDENNRWGWDWLAVSAMNEAGYPMLSTTPSVLQHIGRLGQWSKWRHYDKAEDF